MHDPVALLSQLVAIDSVNPALVPGGAGETAIAEFIADWCRAANLAVTMVEPVPGRPSVVAIAKGTGGGRSLLINAHTDTVGVGGCPDPHQPRIEGNRLYGRGAYDMKAGLAASMIAAATARERGWRGDVIFTAVSDEEHASIGTSSIVERYRADAAIVTEPTNLSITVAHKGFSWWTITTEGVAAHGSLPDHGVDAITHLGPVLVGLGELATTLRQAAPHPLLGTGSIHASLISGGQELSSYPAHCRLDIERRTVLGETPQQVEKQLRAILDRAHTANPQLRATLEAGLRRNPYEIAADAPIVALLQAQATAHLGQPAALTGTFGWLDSALLGEAGIPTVIFGPGGAGAHADEEWADLDSLVQCVAVLTATAEAFCG